MGDWDKPKDSILILRAAKNKYSKKLIDVGSIKFNTPQSWVDYEKKQSKGRGDILEGVFASCHVLDIESVIYYSNLYYDVESEIIGNLIYFRGRRTMNLPCYCFYLLNVNSLPIPKEEGHLKAELQIEGKYFKDFADHISKDEANDLSEEEQPSLVVILDIGEFKKRINDKLISLGLDKSEIMIHIIDYHDKKNPFHCTKKPPNELKIKDKSFSYQKEGRVIINTDKASIIEKLKNEAIEIGCLNDISEKMDDYFYEGLGLQITADAYKIEK